MKCRVASEAWKAPCSTSGNFQSHMTVKCMALKHMAGAIILEWPICFLFWVC
jgi:hypothetical protein